LPFKDLERKREYDRRYRRARRKRGAALEAELETIWPQRRARRGISQSYADTKETETLPRKVGSIEQLALYAMVALNVVRDHVDRSPEKDREERLNFWARQLHNSAPTATSRVTRPTALVFQPHEPAAHQPLRLPRPRPLHRAPDCASGQPADSDQPATMYGLGGEIVLLACPPPGSPCPARTARTCPTKDAERERCLYRYRGFDGSDAPLFAVPGLYVPRLPVKKKDLADVPIAAWRKALADWKGMDLRKHKRGVPIDDRTRHSCRVLVRLLTAGGLVSPKINARAFLVRLKRAHKLLSETMDDICR